MEITFKQDSFRALTKNGVFTRDYIEKNLSELKDLYRNKCLKDIINDFQLHLIERLANNPSMDLKSKIDMLKEFTDIINKIAKI